MTSLCRNMWLPHQTHWQRGKLVERLSVQLQTLITFVGYRGNQYFEGSARQLAEACGKQIHSYLAKRQAEKIVRSGGKTAESPIQATWEEVLEEVQNAKGHWESKTTGLMGMPCRAFRGVEKSAQYANPFLKLFPDGEYTSILCGGLKLIFGVCVLRT